MYSTRGLGVKSATSISTQPLPFGQIRMGQLQTKTGDPGRKSRYMEKTCDHVRESSGGGGPEFHAYPQLCL